MFISTPLSDLMTTRLITLHPKDKLIRVKEIFEEYTIHHIPVVVGNDIVGIISKSDYYHFTKVCNNSYDKFIQDKMLKGKSIDEFMSSEIYALTPLNTVEDAIEIFMENRISCLPIVKGSELVGMVTPYDILKAINEKK